MTVTWVIMFLCTSRLPSFRPAPRASRASRNQVLAGICYLYYKKIYIKTYVGRCRCRPAPNTEDTLGGHPGRSHWRAAAQHPAPTHTQLAWRALSHGTRTRGYCYTRRTHDAVPQEARKARAPRPRWAHIVTALLSMFHSCSPARRLRCPDLLPDAGTRLACTRTCKPSTPLSPTSLAVISRVSLHR